MRRAFAGRGNGTEIEDIGISIAGKDVLAKTPAQAARLVAREEERKEAERSLAAVSDKATLRMTR